MSLTVWQRKWLESVWGSKETNVWPEVILFLPLIFLITVKPFINLGKGGNVTLPFS